MSSVPRTGLHDCVLGMFLLLSAVVVVGCQPHYITKSTRYSAAASDDRYEFQSTVFKPTNVAVSDSLSGRTLWGKEIPTDYTLIIDLDKEGEVEFMGLTGKPATQMEWFMYGPEKGFAVESGVVALPGTPVLITASLREVERPQAMKESGKGATGVTEEDRVNPAIEINEEHTEAAEFSRPSISVDNQVNGQGGGLVPGNSVEMEPVEPDDVDASDLVPSLRAEDLPAAD